ncbi:hypothetical protein M2171_002561 [Bradyrhizobium japonicum USDA 38]|uniref:hypothetical protein n=1 Tax=Bradyrhizobium japonicum TaxID=375 RepID=UPI0012BC76A6|nr:hypothetical protein [Bradyrhizobium japonicum]MCS3893428.1 hypothetical protein [Bradyrhizobium japonicum USDA 38]MCS3945942.1 hypothetical protein [Bradyrhizobium japonicum]
MLISIARGAVVRETTTRRGPWFWLIRPSPPDEFEAPSRIHARAVRTLIKHALIEPVDDIDWRVSTAGLAWLAENGIVATLDKRADQRVTFLRSNGGRRHDGHRG